MTESDRHDTRQALAIAELLSGRGEAVWFTVYPFDAVTWRSLRWESNTRLLVDGWDQTDGRFREPIHLDDFGIDVVLNQISPAAK